MTYKRVRAKAITLANGFVMIVGGDSLGGNYSYRETEFYDPTTDCFSAGPPLVDIGSVIDAGVVLKDGRLLLLDEHGIPGGAQLYDPATGSVASIDLNLGAYRDHGVPTLLHDGRVLVTGGAYSDTLSGLTTITDRALMFDPDSARFRELPARMTTYREFHIAETEPNGKVLIAGGDPGTGFRTAEEFDPTTERFSRLAAKMVYPRVLASSVRLPDGRIVILGGKANYGDTTWHDAEVFDPVSRSFSVFAATTLGMGVGHRTFVEPDGSLIVVRSAGDPFRDSVSDIERLRPPFRE